MPIFKGVEYSPDPSPIEQIRSIERQQSGAFEHLSFQNKMFELSKLRRTTAERRQNARLAPQTVAERLRNF